MPRLVSKQAPPQEAAGDAEPKALCRRCGEYPVGRKHLCGRCEDFLADIAADVSHDDYESDAW